MRAAFMGGGLSAGSLTSRLSREPIMQYDEVDDLSVRCEQRSQLVFACLLGNGADEKFPRAAAVHTAARAPSRSAAAAAAQVAVRAGWLSRRGCGGGCWGEEVCVTVRRRGSRCDGRGGRSVGEAVGSGGRSGCSSGGGGVRLLVRCVARVRPSRRVSHCCCCFLSASPLFLLLHARHCHRHGSTAHGDGADGERRGSERPGTGSGEPLRCAQSTSTVSVSAAVCACSVHCAVVLSDLAVASGSSACDGCWLVRGVRRA